MKQRLTFVSLLVAALYFASCSGTTNSNGVHDITSTTAVLDATAQCGPSSDDANCYYTFRIKKASGSTYSDVAMHGPIGVMGSSADVQQPVQGLASGTTYDFEICGAGGLTSTPTDAQLSCAGADGSPHSHADTTDPSVFTTASALSPTWSAFGSGDFRAFDDCNAGHVDGDYPGTRNDPSGSTQDYGIDSHSAGIGSSVCSGDSGGQHWNGSPPFLTHAIDPPAGFTYAGVFKVRNNHDSSHPGVSYTGEAGVRTLSTLFSGQGSGFQDSGAEIGDTSWYRDEEYFSTTCNTGSCTSGLGVQGTDWNWTWEMHNYPNGPGQPLELGVFNDTSDGGTTNDHRLSAQIVANGITSFLKGPQITAGQWYDVVFQVNWESNSSGWINMWVDGQHYCNKSGCPSDGRSYDGPTMGTGENGYLDLGYYRQPDTGSPSVADTTVYHAATMWGPTAASIGEALP